MSRGLPQKVKMSLEKARDSALLAVECYNKPATRFKSGGYIVLMSIAWTSLFHAFFFKNKEKPYYKEKDKNRYKIVYGEYWYWELHTCVDKYFIDDTNNPIRKNIEFFIPLRNKLEHKSIPEIDSNIFAECQSLLLNFDKILLKEFGENYCLRESLSFALQLYPSNTNLNMAIIENADIKNIVDFIEKYRSSLSTEILQSGEYSFRAFLIQVANHQSKNALPIQFVAYDKLTDEEKEKITRIAALVKDKHIIQPVANKGTIKPGSVIKKVQQAFNNPKKLSCKKHIDKYNMDWHQRCWKKYEVRPTNDSLHPEMTNAKYCLYDEPNGSYLYTLEWVFFLIEQMKKDGEYNSLYNKDM